MRWVIDSKWRLKELGEILSSMQMPYLLEVSPIKKPRSNNQNSLYWAWLQCIANETGHTTEELHAYYSMQFLGTERVECFGRTIDRPKRTSSLTTAEFTEYLQIVRTHAAELQIFLPSPGDPDYAVFMAYHRNKRLKD